MGHHRPLGKVWLRSATYEIRREGGKKRKNK